MKNIAWVPVLVLLLAVVLTGGCNQLQAGFAIYLTRDDIRPSEMASFTHFTLAEMPLISEDDIVSYTKDTHEMELTGEAFTRVNALKIPTYGKSFVVCVGQKQIYWGAFWAGYSSQSFDGVIIGLPSFLEKEHAIQITLGYPSSGFYKGTDPRPDAEIIQSLKKAGKLK
jgi:hypothetical protein